MNPTKTSGDESDGAHRGDARLALSDDSSRRRMPRTWAILEQRARGLALARRPTTPVSPAPGAEAHRKRRASTRSRTIRPSRASGLPAWDDLGLQPEGELGRGWSDERPRRPGRIRWVT